MRVSIFLLTLVVCATDLFGQKAAFPPYRARILGVYDDASGAPLDSVRVTDVLNGNFSLTTPTGTVGLFFLPDGGSLVRLQKLGYEMQTLTIAISPDDTAPITIMMRRVTELGPVVTKARENVKYISPALRGFEERARARTTGYFVGDSILRANEGHRLSEVLKSRMPNIQFVTGAANAMFLVKSARCMGGGPPQVYIDGMPTTPELRPDAPGIKDYDAPMRTVFGQPIPNTKNNSDVVAIDITKFEVGTLAGVEWYPDSDMLPLEFNHTSGRCGALLLWTRER